MKIIELLDEVGCRGDWEKRFVWCVTKYQEGCYEGSGEAVLYDDQGKLWWCNLGHCSCYGPWEQCGLEPWNLMDQFSPDLHTRNCDSDILETIVGLLLESLI